MTDAIARYMRPQLLVMMALFLGAAVAGVLLLPGDAERVAMLERDGSNERALQILEARHAGGDRSQRTLYQLEKLHAHFGNLPRAREMLEQLAAARPRDHVLQRRLVDFYRSTQDSEAYLSALSRFVSRRYSEAACRELISGLRLIGHFAREREAIERCRLKGYRRVDDIVRLAELEAASGNTRQAANLLRKVDDLERLTGDRERLTLAQLLVASGERADAVRRGVRWVKAADAQPFAASLLAALTRRGGSDVALDIARQAGRLGDGVSLSVAEIMLERDQTSAAQAYLRGWLQHAALVDRDLTERFIAVALDAEDPDLALTAARSYGIERISEPQLVAMAEALGALGKRDAFESVKTVLSANAIVAHPLLAAMVELNRGASQSSRDMLSKVSADALDRWRLALWARLMRDTGNQQVVDTKLRELGVTTAALPRIERRRTRRAVRLAADLRKVAEARKAAAIEQRTEAVLVQKRPRKPHILRLAQMKRVKSVRVRHSSHRPGGLAGRPPPISRPLAQAAPKS